MMAKGVKLSHGYAKRVGAAVLAHEAQSKLGVPPSSGNRSDDLYWFNLKNESGETIPGYSVVRLSDTHTITDGVHAYKGQKPSTTFGRMYAVTCPTDCAAGRYVMASLSAPIKAKYDSGTPSPMETWGPKPGQWTICRGYPGFTVLGVADYTNKIAVVVPQSGGLIGKTDETIGAISSNTPGTGTVSIYYRNLSSGALTDTTMNAEVYNMAGEVACGAYMQLKWIGGDLWIDVENCGA